MSSRSPRSTATSTFTSTTSRASRRCPVRRARCMARAPRRAPSASSPTSRIRTRFAAGYDLEGNTVDHGGSGYTFEGFVNIPITDIAAVRLVGWDEKDAGYIDNVHGTVTFPTSGITFDNANAGQEGLQRRRDQGRPRGAQGRSERQLDDHCRRSWARCRTRNGNFGFNPAVGDLEISHYFPETSHDSWVQSALTIEGKISNFDLVYAGAYLDTQHARDRGLHRLLAVLRHRLRLGRLFPGQRRQPDQPGAVHRRAAITTPRSATSSA